MAIRLVHSVRFNQDKSLFVTAGEDGVRIFNVDPLRQLLHLGPELVGTVTKADILERSNVLALVGGGSAPKFMENVVRIWDAEKGRVCVDVTFSGSVIDVQSRAAYILAVTLNKVHLFSAPPSMTKLVTLETRENPRGLCPISSGSTCDPVLAFLGLGAIGSVQILNMAALDLEHNANAISCPDDQRLGTKSMSTTAAPVNIQAHKSEIACLSLNRSGTKFATASVKGTLVRVWDTRTRMLLTELRRGADTASVYCLSFSPDDAFLSVASDKGTVHVFALARPELNRRSALGRVSQGALLGSYLESQWSLATFTVPAELPSVCAVMSEASCAYAVCVDGSCYKHRFTLDGVCNRESFDRFIDLGDNSEL